MAVENWVVIQQMVPKKWTCGHCGLNVGGNRGYYRNDGGHMNDRQRQNIQQNKPGGILPQELVTEGLPRIFICPNCDRPTYFEKDKQLPGVAYGSTINHLPPDVESLYTESRNCMAVSAFTASVLATRKLLMNVAVHLGADTNKTFQIYVNYLADNGYVPPNSRGWVDHIRTKGNEATHEIPAIREDDAKDLLTFMEMILKMVFEYPQRIPRP